MVLPSIAFLSHCDVCMRPALFGAQTPNQIFNRQLHGDTCVRCMLRCRSCPVSPKTLRSTIHCVRRLLFRIRGLVVLAYYQTSLPRCIPGDRCVDEVSIRNRPEGIHMRVFSRRLTCGWSRSHGSLGRIYSRFVWLRQASLAVKRHSTWC